MLSRASQTLRTQVALRPATPAPSTAGAVRTLQLATRTLAISTATKTAGSTARQGTWSMFGGSTTTATVGGVALVTALWGGSVFAFGSSGGGGSNGGGPTGAPADEGQEIVLSSDQYAELLRRTQITVAWLNFYYDHKEEHRLDNPNRVAEWFDEFSDEVGFTDRGLLLAALHCSGSKEAADVTLAEFASSLPEGTPKEKAVEAYQKYLSSIEAVANFEGYREPRILGAFYASGSKDRVADLLSLYDELLSREADDTARASLAAYVEEQLSSLAVAHAAVAEVVSETAAAGSGGKYSASLVGVLEKVAAESSEGVKASA